MRRSTNTLLLFLSALLVAFFLAGCDDEELSKLGTNPQKDPAEVQEVLNDKKLSDDKLLGDVKANVEVAYIENEKQPPSSTTIAVKSELGLAKKRLENVKTSENEKADAQVRVDTIYQGRLLEAQKMYEDAGNRAAVESEKRIRLEEQLNSSLRKQKEDSLKFENDVRVLKGQITKLQEAEKSKQALTLRLIGAGFILIFGLAVGFGGIAGLKLGWVPGLIGLLFFGTAQLVTQPWFQYAVLGIILVVVILVAWWIYQQHRAHTLTQSLQTKAEALKKIVPVIDDAWDSATDEKTKEWLKSNVIARLSAVMDKGTDKAAIHEVRAENASNK